MPGPYAHITLLNELMYTERLKSIFSPLSEFPKILETDFQFCSMGAVSPDYPNLDRRNMSASLWADAMHCTNACQMITSGVKRVRNSKGATRNKQLAWLLGYCSHVVADVTIHPIVQAKVGPYAENQRQHRICEMNQDSYIFRRANRGNIGESNNYEFNISRCSELNNAFQLDDDIVTLWNGMFEDIHPQLFVSNPPDSVLWHREFVLKVDSDCSNGNQHLFPLARVIAAKLGMDYPRFEEVDHQFVAKLVVPSEIPIIMHYDKIFDLAAGNVAAMWKVVEEMIEDNNSTNLHIQGEWNLDTGCDEHGRLVFW